MSEFTGTQIGADGRRYNTGTVPALTRDDVVGRDYHVYGTPGAGKVVQWNNTKQRAEWVTASGGDGGGSAVPYGEGFCIYAWDEPWAVDLLAPEWPWIEDTDGQSSFNLWSYNGSLDEATGSLVVPETGHYKVRAGAGTPETPTGVTSVTVLLAVSNPTSPAWSVVNQDVDTVLFSGLPNEASLNGSEEFTAVLRAGTKLRLSCSGTGGDGTVTFSFAEISIQRVG